MANKDEVLAIIQPGDILMYRAKGTWYNSISNAIVYGSWTGQPGEAIEYAHAGIVLSPAEDKGYEQNPPATHYTKLSAEDWKIIDVFRLRDAVVYPKKLEEYAAANLGTKYPYAKIGQFLGASLVARIGLIKAAKWINNLWGKDDPHNMVCSATVCDALGYATKRRDLWPKADADMRPADIPLGKVIRIL